jgi:hypothetical protein
LAKLQKNLGEASCQLAGISTSGTVPSFGSSRRNHRSHRICSHANRSLDSLGIHRNVRNGQQQRRPVARRCQHFPGRRDGTWRD